MDKIGLLAQDNDYRKMQNQEGEWNLELRSWVRVQNLEQKWLNLKLNDFGRGMGFGGGFNSNGGLAEGLIAIISLAPYKNEFNYQNTIDNNNQMIAPT